LIGDLNGHGIEAHFLPDAASIAEYLASHAEPGDVIAVMSNGGFGGIHDRLAEGLARGVAHR
jgi:UDP-N-acetylmuramate: L-alanyl-gamma-D-glutamyl-meso-diaminopimelate ligase